MNRANEVLQEKLSETERILEDANLRMDKELIAAANKLENRERVLAEERKKLREARETMEAYREMLNSQMDDEREEETRRESDSATLSALTLELENVRQNHQHLVEAQEEEMRNARVSEFFET